MQRKPLIGEAMVRLTNESRFRRTMRRFSPRLPEWFIDQLWEDYDIRSRRAMMEMYRAAPPTGFERLVPLFRALNRPALVLWGGEDPFVPVEQAYQQERSFPLAEVAVLQDCGHWLWIEDPEGAAARIVPFLQTQLGQTSHAAGAG